LLLFHTLKKRQTKAESTIIYCIHINHKQKNNIYLLHFIKEKQYVQTCKSLVQDLTENIKDGKTKKHTHTDTAIHYIITLNLTWKSCDGRIIAVSLNHVICGLGFPSTWHSNCTVVPSGARLGCNFCTKRGAVACSPGVSSAEL
jgi:hypothetical protein